MSNDAILDTFCGDTSTKWLASSGPEMILRLQTFTEIAGRGFDVAYFSDRPQQGCGAHLVPPALLTGDDQEWWASSSSQQRSVLRASSFLFSDGSAPDAAARPSQDCEWILAPPVTATTRVVVAFPRLDLGDAGSLNVTQADTGAVLFSCRAGGCDAPPPPLSVACGSLAYADRCAIRVAYSTLEGSYDMDWGTGFLAHYFVASAPNTETDKVPQTPGTDEGFGAASRKTGPRTRTSRGPGLRRAGAASLDGRVAGRARPGNQSIGANGRQVGSGPAAAGGFCGWSRRDTAPRFARNGDPAPLRHGQRARRARTPSVRAPFRERRADVHDFFYDKGLGAGRGQRHLSVPRLRLGGLRNRSRDLRRRVLRRAAPTAPGH